jgi:type II secretory pathway component PulF
VNEPLTKLQRENSELRFWLRAVLSALNLGLLAASFYRFWTIPQFKEVLAGMGEGQPLPMLTVMVFKHVSLIATLSLALGAVGLFTFYVLRSFKWAMSISISTALLQLLIFLGTTWATFAPLTELMNNLGGEPL